jgi:C-terminal processing protease CtpA/Prc
MLCGGDMQPSFASDREWERPDRPAVGRPAIGLVRRAGLPTILWSANADIGKRIVPGSTLLAVDGKRVIEKDPIDIVSRYLVPLRGRSVRLTVLGPKAQVATVDVPAANARTPALLCARTMSAYGSKLGYIRAPVFQPGEFATRCRSFVQESVAGLVLDLRDCPGWLEGMVADAAYPLVPEGTQLCIVRTWSEQGIAERRVVAKPGSSKLAIPAVLLVNEGTAGGAEILAAALIDNGVPAIGQRTFGRGLIRLTRRVEDLGGYLSVLKGEYLRATGKPIFPDGVAPQRQVNMDRAALVYFGGSPAEDAQLQAALRYLARGEGSSEAGSDAEVTARSPAPLVARQRPAAPAGDPGPREELAERGKDAQRPQDSAAPYSVLVIVVSFAGGTGLGGALIWLLLRRRMVKAV